MNKGSIMKNKLLLIAVMLSTSVITYAEKDMGNLTNFGAFHVTDSSAPPAPGANPAQNIVDITGSRVLVDSTSPSHNGRSALPPPPAAGARRTIAAGAPADVASMGFQSLPSSDPSIQPSATDICGFVTWIMPGLSPSQYKDLISSVSYFTKPVTSSAANLNPRVEAAQDPTTKKDMIVITTRTEGGQQADFTQHILYSLVNHRFYEYETDSKTLFELATPRDFANEIYDFQGGHVLQIQGINQFMSQLNKTLNTQPEQAKGAPEPAPINEYKTVNSTVAGCPADESWYVQRPAYPVTPGKYDSIRKMWKNFVNGMNKTPADFDPNMQFAPSI
jgi:hypothetical protein